MGPAIFDIDRTKKSGQALYELLKNSTYAKKIKPKVIGTKKKELTFKALNNDKMQTFC